MGATRASHDARGDAGAGSDLLEGAVEVDYDAAVAALRVATGRFTDVVRAIDEPRRRTRGLDWSLGDTAAHVLQTVRYDLGTMTGKRETYPVENGDVLGSGRTHNALMLRREPERDPHKLAAAVDEVVSDFIEETARRDPRDPAPLAGGKAMTIANLVGTILGEMILHGYDIARTTGKDLAIDPEAARLAVYATTATLPLAVDERATASLDARLEMRIRGGRSFVIHLDHGRARTKAPGGNVDLYMSADPIAYLLVGFGRSGPWRQVLRGRMFAWGRRPMLAAKLPTFFRNP